MPLGGSGIHDHVAPWQGTRALSQLPSCRCVALECGLGRWSGVGVVFITVGDL